MWRWTKQNTLEYRGYLPDMRSTLMEVCRLQLERWLTNHEWNEILCPWLSKDDRLWENGNLRILTDEGGVFLYIWQPGKSWHRFAGYAGFARTIIFEGFDKMKVLLK